MSDKEPNIKLEPINVYNENEDRFVLTIDNSDNSIYFYDNHKRDGYGLYAGDKFKFKEGKISVNNFNYLFEKLNEYYRENQVLKKDNDYHQMIIGKLNNIYNEYEDIYIKTYSKDKGKFKIYQQLLLDLEQIIHELEGDDYE